MDTLVIIAAIATAFNFLVILWKYEHSRYLDAFFDLLAFIVIGFLFSGTAIGLQIGMIASAIISTYLLISPPKINSFNILG